jgi:hypothetical protein
METTPRTTAGRKQRSRAGEEGLGQSSGVASPRAGTIVRVVERGWSRWLSLTLSRVWVDGVNCISSIHSMTFIAL